MTLSEYAEVYILEHDLRFGTAAQYRYSATNFERWHGRPIDIETDLTTTLVNRYLHWMKERGSSSYTRKSRRGNLVTLWRAMLADPEIPFSRSPDRILRVRCETLDVECFSYEQTCRLIAHCRTLPGFIRGTRIPRALYYESFVRTAWDCCVRLGDLLRFTPATVDEIVRSGGHLRVSQSKAHGRFVDCYFFPSTISALQACVAAERRKKVWPLWARREQFYVAFKKVVRGAGLEGTTKYLRRGAATEAEIASPGSAPRKLGHSPNSYGLADKFYIAGRLLPRRPIIGRELAA